MFKIVCYSSYILTCLDSRSFSSSALICEAASSAPAASALSEGKVNINTASKEELIGLNGIGEVLADRIIKYREANGGYKDVRELTNVKGIGEKLLEKLLPYVTV